MSYYVVNILTGATGAGSPHAVLRTGADRVLVRFIKVSNTAATANGVAYGLKGAGTTTPTITASFLAIDPLTPACSAVVDSAWSAAPGVPAAYYDRAPVAASIGTGWIFSYQKDGPLRIEPNSSLALFNYTASAGGILAISFEIEI